VDTNAIEGGVFADNTVWGGHGDEDGDLEHLDADFVGAGGWGQGIDVWFCRRRRRRGGRGGRT
jgi:hypothetical protein